LSASANEPTKSFFVSVKSLHQAGCAILCDTFDQNLKKQKRIARCLSPSSRH